MKLALLARVAALPLVAAATEEPVAGLREVPHTEAADGKVIPDFARSDGSAYVLADLEQNFYCFEPQWADCNCYKPSESRQCYPKCCTRTRGNCPNDHMPPCDNPHCVGNCVPPDDPRYERSRPGQDDPDSDRSRPEPDNRLPCSSGRDCSGGDFCQSAPPTGDQPGACNPREGLCTPMPDKCGYNSKPVCGCDGNTYPNECDAMSKQMSIQCMGECPCQGDSNYDPSRSGSEPEPDNRLPCSSGRDCSGGDFCQSAPPMEDQPGTCNPQEGLCTLMPDKCGYNYNPVCGCDGNTYPTECAAMGHGVSIQCEGKCPCQNDSNNDRRPPEPYDAPSPQPNDRRPPKPNDGNPSEPRDGRSPMPNGRIACTGDWDCMDGEFCQTATPRRRNQLGSCDPQANGICASKPWDCGTDKSRVCGCDGYTYQNSCDAGSQGMSIRCKGKCPCRGDED